MGLFSCNAESAIATCGSYELLTKKTRKAAAGKRPGEITKFNFTDLDTATNGFSPENLLGQGSYGSVYKARIHRINLIAAVKKTKRNLDSTAADNEVEILSRIYHPCLVNLLGFGLDPGRRKLIVVEYMPHGSLYELLHGSSKPPGWVKRVRFAVQIALAVHFLHSSNPPIIHRDIKSSNVLIDAGFHCRVSDFGLALRGHVEDVKVRSTPPAGTLGYLDPGYLAPGDLSPKSDVFSFGILLLEIITGRKAIDFDYSPSSVIDWAVPAIKSDDFEAICDPRIGLPEDSEYLRRMAVLAAKCVRSTAEKRPGMAEALECLKSVYKGIKQKTQMCGSLRRRVGEGSRACKYEPLDDSVDVVRSTRRNGKVSSAASVEPTDDMIGDRVGRSKSMGTAGGIKLVPADNSYGQVNERRVGLNMRMTKSRSMGIMQSKRLVNSNGAVVRSRTWARNLEESKLLIEFR
ncbi:hypothetical protein CASFOL_002274 [Castilleja foliolosa]|uniref:Protein kinase domain-containing protein n=1 Tax=Castilleja foliolosa TaxID=1961234 RepID=A0ABD3EE34_9LAMI